MRNDLTELILIVDRSGSMDAIRSDAQGAINKFIEEHKRGDGDACLTLVQFDTEYDFVERRTPIQNVGDYTLVPRGWTALLDAVGRTIATVGEDLAKTPESDRPGLVLMAIMTDGLENSSKEFTFKQVNDMIKEQRDTYSWKINFLGAELQDSDQMGISPQHAVQVSAHNYAQGASALNAKYLRARTSRSRGQTVTDSDFNWTDEERQQLK